jgi:hypothetical protein
MEPDLQDFICLLAECALDSETASRIAARGISRATITSSAHQLLRYASISEDQQVSEAAIRMALHLSPPSAIRYEDISTKSRWQLIKNHLEHGFGIASSLSERLARKIADVLADLEEGRRLISHYRDLLLDEQNGRCALCGFDFRRRGQRSDPYKPYDHSWEELTEPEVDHKKPISALGGNQLANLQVLCRLCNFGKGRGIAPSAIDEYRHCTTNVEDIAVGHRIRCASFIFQRDGRCSRCDVGPSNCELTVRKQLDTGPFLLSNLTAVCLRCIDASKVL